MTAHYDKTRVTFHHGHAFEAAGIDPEPFATLTINSIVDRALIDAICELMRTHVNETHMDFCNIKISTENWDS
jgi:hypothetical protein